MISKRGFSSSRLVLFLFLFIAAAFFLNFVFLQAHHGKYENEGQQSTSSNKTPGGVNLPGKETNEKTNSK